MSAEAEAEVAQLQMLLSRVDDALPQGIDGLEDIPRELAPILVLFSLAEVNTPSTSDGSELDGGSVLESLPGGPGTLRDCKGFEEVAERQRERWTRLAMEVSARAMVLLSSGHEQLAEREFARASRLVLMALESRRWSRHNAEQMLRAAINLGMTKASLVAELDDDIPF